MSLLRRNLCAAVVALTASACGADTSDPGIRVVLITLDTLRYDRFRGTEEAPSKMPRTLEHAERGLVFSRFYTVSGVTQPAHATLFTGLAPWAHGVTRNGIVLPKALPNIVETLSTNGYETRAVVASFPLTRRFGFARGFDAFTEEFAHRLSPKRSTWEGAWKVDGGAFFATADVVTGHALEALDRASAPRQFFWFHYFDPHAPYGASSGSETLRRHEILREAASGQREAVLARAGALYDADVAALDRSLDELLRRLAAEAAEFETHVVVVSDHGESLGEGDSVGHGARLNPAELRVPAFILSPRIEAGVRNDVVGAIDLAPTLLSLAGIEAGSMRFEGRDLTGPPLPERLVYAMRRTAREPDQSETRLDGRSYPLSGFLFGAVDRDGTIWRGNDRGLLPGESPEDETLGRRIREHFAAFASSARERDTSGPLDPEVRRGLEALGYVE